MSRYVYRQTERSPALYTVGFFPPGGEWEAESDHTSPGDASKRVHWLNGGELEEDVGPVEGKRYVVGFLFNEDESAVTLLRKSRPEWQAGKLNGVGGHVEKGESYDAAMAREAREECGLDGSWEHFASIKGEGWTMHCYVTHLAAGQQTEDSNDVGEPFEKCPVSMVTAAEVETIPNLRWLVPMAMSTNRGEWPYAIRERAPR